MSARSLRRLGLVRLSAIGDVIHSLPLAHGLKERFPDAELTWIVQAEPAALLANHPVVDRLVIFPRRAGLRSWWRFLKKLRKLRLQAVVDSQGNGKSGLVSLLTGAPLRCGLHVRDCKEWINALVHNRYGRPGDRLHGVDRAWRAAAGLGLGTGPDRFGLFAAPHEIDGWRRRCESAGADPLRPLLAVQLTDPQDVRAWTTEGYAEVVRAALAAGEQVVLNGTAVAAPVAAAIRDQVGAGVFDLVGKDDLRGLLAQFQDMATRPGNRLLAPDCGPLHLAEAVGLPAVCLSGPQDPVRTGPRRGVAVHAWEGLACAPCLERTCLRRPPDRACMQRIDPTAVWRALGQLAGRRRP